MICCVCISSYTCVLHDLSGVLLPKMDINLCGVQVRVSKPLLQLERRDPLLGLTGGKRMPEGMTGGLLGNPRLFAILDHKLANPSLLDRLTVIIAEYPLTEIASSR